MALAPALLALGRIEAAPVVAHFENEVSAFFDDEKGAALFVTVAEYAPPPMP